MIDYKKGYVEIVDEDFPEEMTISLGGQTLRYRKRTWAISSNGKPVRRGLRYGENPGQQAALYELVEGTLTLGGCTYAGAGDGLVSSITEKNIVQIGKHPSMNNLTDVDSGLNILKFFGEKPTVVIVKHNNPSGVAERQTLREAYVEANAADSVAAFGGAAVFNRAIDKETASEIVTHYLEVVCAPGFDEEALALLRQKKNLRILRLPKIAELSRYAAKRFLDVKALIGGGLIVQQSALLGVQRREDFRPATAEHEGKAYAVKRKPTEREYEDLLFGWKVEQGVTSNSVIYVKNRATVAIGTGGQDRVGVAEMTARKAYIKYGDRMALEKTGAPYWVLADNVRKGKASAAQQEEIDRMVEETKGNLNGAVMVSDGFFPFRDTVDVAAKYGVRAIVQPGGSVRDYESIEACNEHGIAMVFTGIRAFRH